MRSSQKSAYKRPNSSSAVMGTIPVVGLWALSKPIMTALFIALLSLRNSLASDAQFKKGEAIFFLFSPAEKKKKRILAEVDFPREGSGPQIHTTSKRRQRLSLENSSGWESL